MISTNVNLQSIPKNSFSANLHRLPPTTTAIVHATFYLGVPGSRGTPLQNQIVGPDVDDSANQRDFYLEET